MGMMANNATMHLQYFQTGNGNVRGAVKKQKQVHKEEIILHKWMEPQMNPFRLGKNISW